MKIIASRNSSSNKKYMFDQIEKDLRAGRSVYYVVPEQFTLSTELELFDALQLQSIVDLKVKSFRSIINEILVTCGGARLNFLSEQAQKLILKISISQVEKDLKVYKKACHEEGFVALVHNFIKTLKSNMIRPEDLKQRINESSYRDLLKDKLWEIYLIYDVYQKHVDKSSYDSQDRIDLAIDKVKLMENFRGISFYFDQFASMSRQEIKLIEEIENLSKDLYFSLVLDPKLIGNLDKGSIVEAEVEDGAVFEVSRKLLRSLYEIDLDFVALKDSKHVNEDIDRMLRRVFSYRIPGEIEDSKAIQNVYINRFKNTKEECENIVAQINKSAYKDGLRYRDIAVVVSDQGEYYDELSRQLTLNKIPFFMDRHRSLLENPVAKYIKSAISLLGSPFSYEDITAYIKQGFFDIEQDKLNIFQNYIKERKIIGNMIFEDRYFQFSREDDIGKYRYLEEDRANCLIAKEVRDIFIESISTFGSNFEEIKENRDKKATIKYFCTRIYEFISMPQAFSRIIDFEESLKGQAKNELLEENRLVWNKFIEILDDFSNVDMDIDLSYEEFSKYLQESIAEIKIGIVPPSQDQVLIGNLERSRFMHVKRMYVLGLSNKFFPKSHQEADIFLEGEKEELIQSGIDIDNTHKSYTDKDMFALYTVFSKALEEIHISYSLINSSNESMEQSSIVNYIVPVINRAHINYGQESYKDNIYSKNKLIYYIPTMWRKYESGNGGVDEKEYNFIYTLIKKIEGKEEYAGIINSIKPENRFQEKNKELGLEAIKEVYTDDMKFSISQIESFNQCPYRHFISYGIKPREDTSFDMDSMSFGNITHKTVDQFVRSYDYREYANQEQVLDVISEDFDKNVKEYILDYQLEDSRNEYYIDRLRDMLGVSCYILSQQLKILKPDKIYTEVKYGDRGVFPPLSYNVDHVEYKMAGVIDRVDEYDIDGEKYRRIIDYKTGSKAFDLNRVYQGLDIQLLVYLYTVSNNFNGKAIGAYYEKLNHKYREAGDSDNVDTKILKKHYIEGISISDVKILSKVDSSFEDEGRETSKVLKNGGTSKDYLKRGNFVEEKVFNGLFKHINDSVEESISNITKGDIEVKPYRLDKESPCRFCSYKAICKFKNDNYKILEKLKDEDIIEKLGGDNGDN